MNEEEVMKEDEKIIEEIRKERDEIDASTDLDVTFSLELYVLDLLDENDVAEGSMWVGSASMGIWYKKTVVKERETKFFEVYFVELFNDERNEKINVYLLKLKKEYEKYEDEVIE